MLGGDGFPWCMERDVLGRLVAESGLSGPAGGGFAVARVPRCGAWEIPGRVGRETAGPRVPRRESRGPCVWLHAVSVGEVLLLRTVIDELRRVNREVDVWISTTTQTGHAVAAEQFPDCRVVYFPLDFTWSVAQLRCAESVRMSIGLVGAGTLAQLHSGWRHGKRFLWFC